MDVLQILWQIIQTVGYTVWAMIKAFLSLLPIVDQINGLQDQIMAAALGIPVAIISIGGTIFAVGKFVWRCVND